MNGWTTVAGMLCLEIWIRVFGSKCDVKQEYTSTNPWFEVPENGVW